jgi:hypothetical protein
MKTELKVVLFSCSGMLIIAIIAITGIFKLFTSSVDKMESARYAEIAEYKRITGLNTIKGVIVNNGPYVAPFSKDSVGLCLLQVGKKISYSNSHRHHTGRRPKHRFALQFVVAPESGAAIKIGTTTYPVDFSHLLPALSKQGKPYGYKGMNFETDSKYTNTIADVVEAFGSDKAKMQDKKEKYRANTEKLKSFYGVDEMIDRFVEHETMGKKSFRGHIQLVEILYKTGDSIAIKGKIENGRIIPLY